MREVFSVAAVVALLWPSVGVAENFVGVDGGFPAARPAAAASSPVRAAADAAVPTTGAYKSLSAGNQQIAEALFNSQSVGAGTRQAWSLDRIASAKRSGAGWGQVFQQMHAEGVIPEKNLGSVLTQSRRPASSAAPKRATVIVTGAGKVYFAGGSGRSAAPADRGPARRDDVADDRPAPVKAVAQRPAAGRGWIAASGGRSGTPAYGVATASSQGIHGGSVGLARAGRARN
jgi:hypothetical protein